LFAPDRSGANKVAGRGGQNKEIIMMTVNAFKSFCLKANTKKADEIHNYYIKLEEMLQSLIEEEGNELRTQLLVQKNQLENVLTTNQKDKDALRERTLLEQFPKNVQCIYYGAVDNKSVTNENLIKFGYSNDLNRRTEEHKKNFTNFHLINVFRVTNQIQIENAIKAHPILKKKRRNIIIENKNNTELLAIDGFTFEQIDTMIKEIIQNAEYNIENYNKMVEKNAELEYLVAKLNMEAKEKNEEIENLKQKLANYKPELKTNGATNSNIVKYGYFMYAFEYEPMRYKCSIVRQSAFEGLTNNLKCINNDGDMKYHTKINNPFMEKIMAFLMKESLCSLGVNKYEGSFEDVKKIIDTTVKIEEWLIKNAKNLDNIVNMINISNEQLENALLKTNNPEVPVVRKAKRPIDQVDPATNKAVASYESIEAAGRAFGLTTGTAIGIALRNKSVSCGFLWRYAGVSHDDQYKDQPVIKVCCSTGEKTHFKNIADAARDADAKISAPGLRARILTNVHVNGFHWIFDKTATHYGN
jgi:hypothetical protein